MGKDCQKLNQPFQKTFGHMKQKARTVNLLLCHHIKKPHSLELKIMPDQNLVPDLGHLVWPSLNLHLMNVSTVQGSGSQ